MKKKFFARGIALGLAVVTAFSMCGCSFGKGAGTGGGGNKKSDKHYFNAEYPSNLPAAFSSDRLSKSVVSGDWVYYCYYDEDYEGSTLEAYNILTGETEVVFEGSVETDEMSRTVSATYINDFTPTTDGDVAVFYAVSKLADEFVSRDYSNATLQDILDYFVQQWGYSENDAAAEWADYYESYYMDEEGNVDYAKALANLETGYDSEVHFALFDLAGNAKFDNNVETSLYGQTQENGTYSYISSVAIDENGIPAAIVNEYDETKDIYYIRVYDKSGKQSGMIELEDWVDSFVTINGQVYINVWGEENEELRKVDLEKLTIEEKGVTVPGSSVGYFDDENILVNDYTSLVKLNLSNGEQEEYINLLENNISSYSVNSFGKLSDGRIVVLYTSGSSQELVILTEVDESEVKSVTTIKIACMWVDSDYEQKAIEFNKKHDDVKITFTKISDDAESWQEMMNNFVTAVANDSTIDVVLFPDVSCAQNMINKGLLVDMYPLIDADSEISRDDFMPNVLTACESDGKLMLLGSSFSVMTVVGKASDVGTEPGWTVNDMQALLASKPEGTQLFYGVTREEMLTLMMNLGYNDYISVDGKCNFDSPEFVQALEFANMFPEEYEWNEDDDSSMMLHNGEVLLDQFYISDFNSIQLEETVMGGELTYIGYPSNGDSNGALLSLDNPIGITKNCDNADVAWEFLRESFKSSATNYQDSSYYYGDFPVRQDEFDVICQKAMEQTDMGTYGWGEFEIEIQPATQESVDKVKNVIYGATAFNGAISDDQLNIIKEEAAYYFSGEQTAESVAKKIQSRMEIYLSETK